MNNILSFSRSTTFHIAISSDVPANYEQRFGALPFWLDEVPASDAHGLLKQALRRGAPLTAADYFH
jgi:hypothetical protein